MHIALILGAIAIATEPGPILQLTKRYHTKGDLTDTLVPLHGVEDAFAIIVFGLALTYATGFQNADGFSIYAILTGPIAELGFSIFFGIIIGVGFKTIIYKLDYEDTDKNLVVFVTAIVAILLSVSIANRVFL